MHSQSRAELILGHENLEKLGKSKVAVFGVGGVGSICAEALVRSGISNITLIDGDKIEITNINRQIPALHSTLGEDKAKVMAQRLADINPKANIEYHNKMWHKNSDFINFKEYAYIFDAIDSFNDKIDLIEMCRNNDVRIISSMGAGGRIRGDLFEICDISKTYNDPLAKKVRTELKKRRISNLKVVFSKELPIKAKDGIIGSVMYAVACAGLLLAGEGIKDLIGE